MLALAIDLGGTNIRAGLVEPSGRILSHKSIRTRAMEGPEVVLDQVASLAAEVIAGATVAGVAMCAPGPLDTITGQTFFIQTLHGFEGFPLRQALSSRLKLPVQVENDGITGALAELCFGAGQGLSDFLYVTISTGIGGGIVADGRPLRGRRGMAGHVGHMFFHRDWPRHLGGRMTCLEDYGAGPALAARARAMVTPASALHGAEIDARKVYEAAAAGDPLARQLVADEADLLGTGLASLSHILSPQAVILGGGMSQAFDQLAPGIRDSLARHLKPGFDGVTLLQAQLGTDSSLVGAAALIFRPELSASRPA